MSDNKAAISAAKAHQAIIDMADAFREDERKRIIWPLDQYTFYRFEKDLVISLIENGRMPD